jgi:hypothetical protein
VVPSWFEEDTRVDPENEEEFDFATKVNQVCLKLRSVMREAGVLDKPSVVAQSRKVISLLPILSRLRRESAATRQSPSSH